MTRFSSKSKSKLSECSYLERARNYSIMTVAQNNKKLNKLNNFDNSMKRKSFNEVNNLSLDMFEKKFKDIDWSKYDVLTSLYIFCAQVQ